MNPEKTQAEINRDIHAALFGDPETGEKGIVPMTKEMYEAWSAVLWIGKFATWLAIIVAAFGTIWVSFGGNLRRILLGK